MSPLVAVKYLERLALISARTHSGEVTTVPSVMLSIADLIQQLAAENAELRRALKLSGQVMRDSIGEEDE